MGRHRRLAIGISVAFVALGAAAPVRASAWTIEPTPVPAGGQGTALLGVACPRANRCVAVGQVLTPTLVDEPMAQLWDGTAWTLSPVPSTPGGLLEAVSCPTRTACMAVGSIQAPAGGAPIVALAERWDAGTWRVLPTPVLSSDVAELLGISCRSARRCVAVGDTVSAGTAAPLVQRWEGRAWRQAPAPVFPGTVAQLSGVSCPVGSGCVVVGAGQTASGSEVPVAARAQGASWQLLPTPALSSWGVLAKVSCATRTDCVAVGYRGTATGEQTLAEHFDGSSWTVELTPNPPPPAQSFLSGVSCPVAGVCMATGGAGSFNGSNVPLAERRERGTWTLQMPAAPAGFTTAFLQGSVACALPGVCQAVGSEQTGPVFALAEGFSRTG